MRNTERPVRNRRPARPDVATGERAARPQRPQRPSRDQNGLAQERPTRPQRPKRSEMQEEFDEELRPARSDVFTDQSEDFDNSDFTSEDFTDEEFGFSDSEASNSDFGGFEEFPDEDYEDFSTEDKQAEDEYVEEVDDAEDDIEVIESNTSARRPPRRSRPRRAEQKPQNDYAEDEDALSDPEPIQVRHRRVRAQETEDDNKQQMFSFTSDINKMTVKTMLEDIRVDDYDFDEEGNLIKKDEKHDEKENNKAADMHAVESLEDLLSGLEDSGIVATDEELGAKIDKTLNANESDDLAQSIENLTAPEESAESKEEAVAEAEPAAQVTKQVVEDKAVSVASNSVEDSAETAEAEEAEVAEDKTNVESMLLETEDEHTKESGSLLNRLKDISFKYREDVLNNDVENLSDITIKFLYDGDYSVTPSNRNSLSVPNCKVYKNGRAEKWSKAQEVRLNIGDKIDIDFGINIVLPKEYGLKPVYSKDLLTKYGLEPMDSEKVFSNIEAATELSLTFIARSATSYVARYQSLVDLKVVKLNGKV